MTVGLNPLLQRQLRKHLGKNTEISSELMPLLEAISEAYVHYENDRKLMDRAMELSSQELLSNNRTLQHKNEMLDAFVYRVSHDLKAPVNNLLSLAAMLEELQAEQIASNIMVGKTVKSITDTAQRMNMRINDLLDLSRIEQFLDAELEEIELQSMLGQVRHDLEQEIENSKAVIHSDFSRAPTVRGGRENTNSLLSNLLSNAIKYRASDRPPEVTIATSRTPTHTVLKIADNGMGIDLQKHGAKLFGMFNRFHTHVAGTGVGLFIIKKIIDKAGGTIHVESTVGIGTTFIIHFPHASN
jgi:signal transduction histidine kinase